MKKEAKKTGLGAPRHSPFPPLPHTHIPYRPEYFCLYLSYVLEFCLIFFNGSAKTLAVHLCLQVANIERTYWDHREIRITVLF